MTDQYDPSEYWQRRLSSKFTLQGVGHLGFSERYNRWLYRRKRRVLESVLRGIPLHDKDVLDLGCGTGFFVDWYLEQGARVTGVDITHASVERLRQKHPGSTFVVQDITAADWEPSGVFDVVNIWDVLYHVVDDKRFERALRNIASALRPGGRVLATDWFGARHDFTVATHVKARCLSTYQSHFGPLGVATEQVRPLYHFLNRPVLRRLDNVLVPLWFCVDEFRSSIPADNLSLVVWRKESLA